MTHLAVVLSLLMTGPPTPAQPDAPGDHDVWEIAGDSKTVTWLVIHNLTDGRKSGLFHVEVLRRRRTAAAWRVERLAAHMAITKAALRASVRKPLESGRVYPESFDGAFAKWKKLREAGAAPICERTVLSCLKSS